MKPGRTTLITGCSRGIGRSLATCFAAAGDRIVITCKEHTDSLYRLQDEIRSSGGTCLAFPADVSSETDVDALFSACHEAYGPVDILVNNAGISYIGLLSEMSGDEWAKVIATNQTGTFLCSRRAIPDMVHQKDGVILNISSVWGSVGASCEACYAASKGAVDALTRSLAKELAPSNIAVNAIACGMIDTEMNACFDSHELKQIVDSIPAGRMGTSQEVAEFALQLTKTSRYLTGQVIRFDGGWI